VEPLVGAGQEEKRGSDKLDAGLEVEVPELPVGSSLDAVQRALEEEER
jgi:hypothetical protein